jgi:hypothetical protein
MKKLLVTLVVGMFAVASVAFAEDAANTNANAPAAASQPAAQAQAPAAQSSKSVVVHKGKKKKKMGHKHGGKMKKDNMAAPAEGGAAPAAPAEGATH